MDPVIWTSVNRALHLSLSQSEGDYRAILIEVSKPILSLSRQKVAADVFIAKYDSVFL